MTREQALQVLATIDREIVQQDGALYAGVEYVRWEPYDETVVMDGCFTPEQLEALAWWVAARLKS